MGGLFRSRTPKLPKIEPAKPIPVPDDEQIQASRRRLIAKEQRGSGVQSTILSSGGRETLGA